MRREIYAFIYLPGEVTAVPAGLFTHDDATMVGSFEYGRQYQNRANALAVDPISLPLGLPVYPHARLHDGLYGAFRDASPDLWGRQVHAHQLRVPPESLTNIDFMLAANATRVGNLDFRQAADSPEPAFAPPEFTDLESLLEAATAVDEGRDLPPEHAAMIDLLVQGSSIGGARPKATVLYDNELWIAKFPEQRDRFSYAKIEFATLSLARQAGIPVPEMFVRNIGGRDVFFSKRFDRNSSPQGLTRLGYISALTTLNIDERDYTQWSYLRLADTMRRMGNAEGLKQLYARMVYYILLRNTDDHPRNHGFINHGGAWDLSPAFDITPTRATPGAGTSFNLTMTVGSAGKEASIENALSECPRFGLSRTEAQTAIFEMCMVVDDWRSVFDNCGVAEQEMELFAWGIENESSAKNLGLQMRTGSD